MGAPVTPEQGIVERRDWRVRLERDYGDTSARLQTAYQRFVNQARPGLNDLNNRIAQIYQATGEIRREDVRGLPVFQRLVNLIEIELNDFAVVARNLSGDLAEQGIVIGIDAAQNLTLAEAGTLAPQFGTAFVRPAPEALARLIQFADSGVFREKWNKFGANAGQQFADALLTGIAQGKNPRYIARLTSNWLGVPYSWTDNAARTMHLYSYRYANHLTYAANERIIEGWYWIAALDTRTCISCWNQHGTLHGLDETLNDHHKGRCGPSPKLRNIERTVVSGRDRFDQLGETDQRAIFRNNKLYDAWRDGRVVWDDLTVSYQDDLYGEMLRQPTAISLGIR